MNPQVIEAKGRFDPLPHLISSIEQQYKSNDITNMISFELPVVVSLVISCKGDCHPVERSTGWMGLFGEQYRYSYYLSRIMTLAPRLYCLSHTITLEEK